ncbi:MAG: winged helix-turn-helix domain-containing protein [Rhizobiaceae bacterium]|nr:winged helix-turn-helix domain-containing protein [Rhizobiaceae bacterium]MCV0407163.1 winged helix-turn-helix domain-containing protein [Rhizobiaceae bacterium]
MKEGPMISTVAALIGDPARANMLTALMDGRALTVTELASAASVALPTASGHLAKLEQGRLLVAQKQGRHRYFRLSDADIGEAIEKLMGIAQRTGAVRVRTGPRNQAMRTARICYDHMAGERGVALLDALRRSGHLEGEERLAVTADGRRFFADLGIDMAKLEKGRRPVCRACLDWSERRSHLAGALGKALLQAIVERGWARRSESRVLVFTPSGERAFAEAFAL